MRVRADEIIDAACQLHGIVRREMMSGPRTFKNVDARQTAIVGIRSMTGYSFTEIAALMNRRWHGGIVNKWQQFQAWTTAEQDAMLERLEARIIRNRSETKSMGNCIVEIYRDEPRPQHHVGDLRLRAASKSLPDPLYGDCERCGRTVVFDTYSRQADADAARVDDLPLVCSRCALKGSTNANQHRLKVGR